ncbi:mechanosensitive ion channel family protein [Mucilaginibacter arboris]|uniref:Mechanosensitive ion channel n=1 Tax=Mucilaginibacter arboris TaxID=2682090 RepID=A0A7K1SZW2_9SPHI|nr:mechanosensitive ion channel family protein [Mucilaginibacter arboris]MVN22843.1 mechanosensitive ion channel [Mucilaginibacter arboris]
MDLDKAYQLISHKIITWINNFVRLLPNILVSALLMVVGIYAAKLIKKIASSLIQKVSDNSALNNLFTAVIYIFVIAVTIFTVLSILKLDTAVTSILAGAGIIGLALAFAFQDIASNFISGIFISFRRPLRVGHIVKVKDYMGKVEEINLRDTILRTFQGQLVIIPNKDVFQNPIENFSLLGKRRLDLIIGVSYGENLEQVKQVTLETLKGMEHLSAEDEITMFYQEFGGSTINFMLRLWINSPEQATYLNVGSEAIIRLKKAYDKNSIMLPFPTTTLDFGVKGGVPLTDIPIHIAGQESKI